jgi:hypothetical protein
MNNWAKFLKRKTQELGERLLILDSNVQSHLNEMTDVIKEKPQNLLNETFKTNTLMRGEHSTDKPCGVFTVLSRYGKPLSFCFFLK